MDSLLVWSTCELTNMLFNGACRHITLFLVFLVLGASERASLFSVFFYPIDHFLFYIFFTNSSFFCVGSESGSCWYDRALLVVGGTNERCVWTMGWDETKGMVMRQLSASE
jgi:hypothetical protein